MDFRKALAECLRSPQTSPTAAFYFVFTFSTVSFTKQVTKNTQIYPQSTVVKSDELPSKKAIICYDIFAGWHDSSF